MTEQKRMVGEPFSAELSSAEPSSTKARIARLIRAVTVPPVLVCSLLLILFFCRRSLFSGVASLVWSLVFLALVPLSAYPLSAVLPGWRKKGREGQRNLAFVMNLAGYAAALLYGLFTRSSAGRMLIYWTYFLSVAVLLILNKIVRLRASGHACSIAGPLILLCWFLGWVGVLPCLAVFGAVLWSSLALKRHTLRELLIGALSAFAAFSLSLLMISFIG